MIPYFQAIKDLLATHFDWPTYLVWADKVLAQYVIVGEGPRRARPDQMPLCSTDATIQATFRLRAVTGTVTGASGMLDDIRGVLSPGYAATKVPMTGYDLRVWFERTEVLTVDQDTTTVDTNRHPAFGIDTYNLVSQPA